MTIVSTEYPPSHVHLALDESEYWRLVDKYSWAQSRFEAQGEEHGQIDGNLAEDIESILIPYVGRPEGSEVWFQNTDFFLDGIRRLIFKAGYFPLQSLPALRSLLTGETAGFCIAIHLCSALYGSDIRTIGGMAILRDDFVMTPGAAELIVGYPAKVMPASCREEE